MRLRTIFKIIQLLIKAHIFHMMPGVLLFANFFCEFMVLHAAVTIDSFEIKFDGFTASKSSLKLLRVSKLSLHLDKAHLVKSRWAVPCKCRSRLSASTL